jgi:hypothetical protein
MYALTPTPAPETEKQQLVSAFGFGFVLALGFAAQSLPTNQCQACSRLWIGQLFSEKKSDF